MSLRDLHDTLSNRIRALEALGFQSEDNMNVQMVLIPFLQMKLPRYLAEKWELDIEDIDEKDITIDRVFKFLNKQVISKKPEKEVFMSRPVVQAVLRVVGIMSIVIKERDVRIVLAQAKGTVQLFRQRQLLWQV